MRHSKVIASFSLAAVAAWAFVGTAAAAPVLSAQNPQLVFGSPQPYNSPDGSGTDISDIFSFSVADNGLVSGKLLTAGLTDLPYLSITCAFISTSANRADGCSTDPSKSFLPVVSFGGNQIGAESWTLDPVGLGAGDWVLHVIGIDYNDKTRDTYNVTLNFQQQVPEPASLALCGLGLAGLAASRRRKVQG